MQSSAWALTFHGHVEDQKTANVLSPLVARELKPEVMTQGDGGGGGIPVRVYCTLTDTNVFINGYAQNGRLDRSQFAGMHNLECIMGVSITNQKLYELEVQ